MGLISLALTRPRWNALIATEECDSLGYDWSDQAEDGPTNFALMAYTSLGSSCSSSLDTESQLNVGPYKAGLESVEARLDVYKKNEVVFEKDIKILKLDIMLRDNELTELRKKYEKAEKERDDLKLTLEKFENSSKNLRKMLGSQISDKFKYGVGYDSQVYDSQVFDSQVYGNENENETESKSRQRKPSIAKVEFVKSYEHVKSPRESVKKVENSKQANYPRKNSQNHRGNPQLELQEKGVIDSGFSRHMTRNKSYLSDYEEIDGGFVAFGGNSKGGKITGKGKIRTGKLDFEDVYFVKEL
ncbi:hypothetical protein Tco_0496277 [Tanacetum coccineum]